MAKIEINIIKTEENVPKVLRLLQRNVFNTLCKQIFVESENPSTNWTKEQWNDPHKVYIMEDSIENCTKSYNEWVNMNFQTWSSLKVSIKQSKLYRVMPSKIRNLIVNPNTNEKKYYEKFQEFLMALGIFFTLDLKEK